jgi:hypothetical protein
MNAVQTQVRSTAGAANYGILSDQPSARIDADLMSTTGMPSNAYTKNYVELLSELGASLVSQSLTHIESFFERLRTGRFQVHGYNDSFVAAPAFIHGAERRRGTAFKRKGIRAIDKIVMNAGDVVD